MLRRRHWALVDESSVSQSKFSCIEKCDIHACILHYFTFSDTTVLLLGIRSQVFLHDPFPTSTTDQDSKFLAAKIINIKICESVLAATNNAQYRY